MGGSSSRSNMGGRSTPLACTKARLGVEEEGLTSAATARGLGAKGESLPFVPFVSIGAVPDDRHKRGRSPTQLVGPRVDRHLDHARLRQLDARLGASLTPERSSAGSELEARARVSPAIAQNASQPTYRLKRARARRAPRARRSARPRRGEPPDRESVSRRPSARGRRSR